MRDGVTLVGTLGMSGSLRPLNVCRFEELSIRIRRQVALQLGLEAPARVAMQFRTGLLARVATSFRKLFLSCFLSYFFKK